jgi:tRNA(Ile)-lysidine synthase
LLYPQKIVADLVSLAAGKNVWLAYSGGIDSHVLLQILATTPHPDLKFVAAVHIDHGLQTESKNWLQHCADVCKDLDIDYHALQVQVNDIETLGMEAAARAARYQAIDDLLNPDDVLLTAQHQHDQAETLLLQLLRGSGPKGLAAMAAKSVMGKMTVIRPLLDVSQQDIQLYAQQHNLKWIDDPSNIDTRWSRNYLRHKVWPEIEQRWPQAEITLSRSAQHCAEASELLSELAEQDMELLGINASSETLPITALMTLSSARQRNLLRYYIERRQFTLPSTTVLQCVIDEVCLAAQDKEPLVSWSGVEVRRYQQQLYMMLPMQPHDVLQSVVIDDFHQTISLEGKLIEWQQTMGKGLKKEVVSQGVSLGFRQGGERIQLQGQAHHKSLKHLFQQWHIPPWQRDRIPLLFCDDKLIAIVGYGVSDEFAVNGDQQGYFPSLKLVC